MIKQRGLTGCLITLNDAYWLERTFPQMVANTDRMIVLDGNYNLPSTDHTEEVLRAYARPNDLIVMDCNLGLPGNDRNWDLVKRNAYLKHVNTSHMLLIDADEAYLRGQWDLFHEFVDRDLNCVIYPYVHFYVDCEHQLTGDYFDAPCHHFTRFDPSFRYTDISTVLKRPDGKAVATDHLFDDRIRLYHYNRVSPEEIYRERQRKFLPRWDGGNLTDQQINDWLRTWSDDRKLEDPNVKEFHGPHPLEGLI